MTLPKLYTVKECATYMRISTQAVYDMISRSELTSIRCGGQIRVTEKELAKLVGEL